MRARSARLIWPFAGLLVAVRRFGADEIHRNEFAGKNTQFIKGEANVKLEEKRTSYPPNDRDRCPRPSTSN